MLYKAKVGNDDVYIQLVACNMPKLLSMLEETIKDNPSFKIIQIRDSRDKLIDLDNYKRRLERQKRKDKEGYLTKTDINKCYRSIQQSMWYKYSKEEYTKIRIELKKLKDLSNNVDDFKEKVSNYISSIEK